MLKFNMLHLITNLQQYCGQLCEYQISIYCILHFGNLYLQAKRLALVGRVGEKGIGYFLTMRNATNFLIYAL